MRENISELDKLKLDTLINLRIENASLRAELKKKEDDYMVRISSVLAENDNLIIEKNAFRAEVERLNLIVSNSIGFKAMKIKRKKVSDYDGSHIWITLYLFK